MGYFLIGKLGRAWVGAWVGAWVHGDDAWVDGWVGDVVKMWWWWGGGVKNAVLYYRINLNHLAIGNTFTILIPT